MANVVLRPWVKVVGVIAVVAAIMFGASKFLEAVMMVIISHRVTAAVFSAACFLEVMMM